MVFTSIKCCIFESVTLQKIRKNRDANHNQRHVLDIRTVIFYNWLFCKIRTNPRNKDDMVALDITHIWAAFR